MFKSNRNNLVLFVLAWVLTLNGANVILDWTGEILVKLIGISPQTPVLPVVGLTLQLIFNAGAAVLAYLSAEDKALKPMAFVAIVVNLVTIVNSLATFLYAVLSNQLTF